MSLTKIGSIGINTGIAFAGVTTIVTLNTANDALSIGATVNVGSGITLGASGDIFATGVSTFSGNVKVGTGITLSPDGHIFHTGVVTATTFSGSLAASNLTGALPAISGANLTNLDASDLASGTVPTARLGSGTASSSTFLRGDSTFQTVDTNLVADTSPQLGGDLDTNSHNILVDDAHAVKFGASTDLQIYHNGNSIIENTNNSCDFRIISDAIELKGRSTDEMMLKGTVNGAVDLYYNNSKKLETTNTGVSITGKLETTTFISVAADNQDLKVGAGDDIKLFHDGTDSFIHGTAGTRYLKIRAAETRMVNEANSEIIARFIEDGAVELYYNNVKTFHTKDNGVVIEGTEGANAILELRADEGDNNADYFRLHNDGGFLSFQDYGGGSWQTGLSLQQQNQVRLYYNGSEKLNTSNTGVSISGKIYMNTGNVQFGNSGAGLDFSATSDASGSSSELFNDYEEGTWTPVVYDGNGSNYVIGVNATQCHYTKIGRMVYIFYNITQNESGSKTGDLYFPNSCLPYAVGTATQASGTFFVDHGGPRTGLGDIIGGNHNVGTSAVYFTQPTRKNNGDSQSTANNRYLQHGQWSYGRPIYGEFSYRV